MLPPRNPIVGNFVVCCACAASGQVAAPPTSAMNSRRLIRSPRRRGKGQLVRRRLNRKVVRLLTLEDAIHVAGRAPELVDGIVTIGDQAAAVDELA